MKQRKTNSAFDRQAHARKMINYVIMPSKNVEKTAYEKMLESIGVRYEEAMKHLRCRSDQGVVIRKWILSFNRSKFVPEKELNYVGIRTVVED